MKNTNLGIKALHPSFISTREDHSEYFELAFDRFLDTCESLDLEVGDVRDLGDQVSLKVRDGKDLTLKEQRLAATMGYGDMYWVKSCSSWEPLMYRGLGYPFERLLRYKMNRKISPYLNEKFKQPTYSRPSDFEESNRKLRSKVDHSKLLHIEWLEYFLENLEIPNDLDFEHARRSTLDYSLWINVR